jgi:hypothetical protein
MQIGSPTVTIRRACAAALVVSCVAAYGCARIEKRYPPEPEQPATPVAKSKMRFKPPPDAECRERQELEEEDVQEPCDAETPPDWPTWTERQPPGLCYVLDEPCEGVADHVAYLTFDDGPSDWTAQFLDILKSEDVLATFFVNARGIKGQAGLDGTYLDGKKAIPYRNTSTWGR